MLKFSFNKTSMIRRTLQSRDYHIRIADTVIGGDGKPRNPGHIAIYPTKEEQEKHDLSPSYGHNPTDAPGRTVQPLSVLLQIKGYPAVNFNSYITRAAVFSQDKPMNYCDRSIDMGPLSDEQAKILKEWRSHHFYELTCSDPTKGTNCVEEIRQLMEKLEGREIPYIRFETPQGLGQRIKDQVLPHKGK